MLVRAWVRISTGGATATCWNRLEALRASTGEIPRRSTDGVLPDRVGTGCGVTAPRVGKLPDPVRDGHRGSPAEAAQARRRERRVTHIAGSRRAVLQRQASPDRRLHEIRQMGDRDGVPGRDVPYPRRVTRPRQQAERLDGVEDVHEVADLGPVAMDLEACPRPPGRGMTPPRLPRRRLPGVARTRSTAGRSRTADRPGPRALRHRVCAPRNRTLERAASAQWPRGTGYRRPRRPTRRTRVARHPRLGMRPRPDVSPAH